MHSPGVEDIEKTVGKAPGKEKNRHLTLSQGGTEIEDEPTKKAWKKRLLQVIPTPSVKALSSTVI
jgi:hypothetical protein